MKTNILLMLILLILAVNLQGQGPESGPAWVQGNSTHTDASASIKSQSGQQDVNVNCPNCSNGVASYGVIPNCNYQVYWEIGFSYRVSSYRIRYTVKIQQASSYPYSNIAIGSHNWTTIYTSSEQNVQDNAEGRVYSFNLTLPALPGYTYRAVIESKHRVALAWLPLFQWDKTISNTWNVYKCCTTNQKFIINGQDPNPFTQILTLCYDSPIKLDFSKSGDCPPGDESERISIQECTTFFGSFGIGPVNTRLMTASEIQGYGGNTNFDLVQFNNSFNTFSFEPWHKYVVALGPRNVFNPNHIVSNKKIIIYISPSNGSPGIQPEPPVQHFFDFSHFE